QEEALSIARQRGDSTTKTRAGARGRIRSGGRLLVVLVLAPEVVPPLLPALVGVAHRGVGDLRQGPAGVLLEALVPVGQETDQIAGGLRVLHLAERRAGGLPDADRRIEEQRLKPRAVLGIVELGDPAQ